MIEKIIPDVTLDIDGLPTTIMPDSSELMRKINEIIDFINYVMKPIQIKKTNDNFTEPSDPYAEQDEIWTDIKGYENQYQISNLGNIRALSRKGQRKGVERMKARISNWGYPIIELWKNNKRKTFSVHRLVAETFIANPNNKAEVNHKNGIKTDNRVDNLEWVTREENIQHAYDTGLNPRSLPLSKIVLDKKVLCLETGDVFNSLTQAAENYKIPISHLSSCLNKKKHRKTVGGLHWVYCRCEPVSEDLIYKGE